MCGILADDQAILVHERLSISACEVILYLYDEVHPREFLNRMNGIFAFVLHDPRRRTYLIARDPIGVVPLYLGWDRREHLYVASEMKALVGVCERIREVPPGHYYLAHEAEKGFKRYYAPAWAEPDARPDRPYDPTTLREALEAAVRRQLRCDVPYGVLISGGVDSSIVGGLAARHREGRVEEDERTPAWWPRLHSFAIRVALSLGHGGGLRPFRAQRGLQYRHGPGLGRRLPARRRPLQPGRGRRPPGGRWLLVTPRYHGDTGRP